MEHLDEQHRDATTINEAHKKRVKVQYDKLVRPRVFSEGDLVLVYDQDKDALGVGKFKPMWYGPFIIRKVLEKELRNSFILTKMSCQSPEMGSILKNIMPRFMPSIFLVVDIVYTCAYMSIGFIVISIFFVYFGRYRWMIWYI